MIATEIGNSRFIEERLIQLTEIERIKICLKIGQCPGARTTWAVSKKNSAAKNYPVP